MKYNDTTLLALMRFTFTKYKYKNGRHIEKHRTNHFLTTNLHPSYQNYQHLASHPLDSPPHYCLLLYHNQDWIEILKKHNSQRYVVKKIFKNLTPIDYLLSQAVKNESPPQYLPFKQNKHYLLTPPIT